MKISRKIYVQQFSAQVISWLEFQLEGLFRLFLGSAGIKAEEDTIENAKAGSKSRKNTRKGKGAGPKQKVQPAPISILSPSFMLFCLVQSFDSLVSVGTGVNFEVNGKTASHDLAKMLSPFLQSVKKSLENVGCNILSKI